MPESRDEVPSPVDFRRKADARDWADAAMVKRPWRTEFFARIAEELMRRPATALSILELGSGPGFLARHLLTALPSSTYTAVDFSAAMHDIAKEHLGPLARRVTFIEADFRLSGWTSGLRVADAVVTMQAVHELRHKRYAASLYRSVRPLLRPAGVLLTCDHFVGEGGMTDNRLYMTPPEHERAIREAGFVAVEELMAKSGLVLFRAADSEPAWGPKMI